LTIWLPGEPRGEQQPAVLSRPPFVSSAGEEVVELAASAGLVLDPWQRFSLDVTLAERADGKWAAFETGQLVARQNGKGGIIEAICLGALFLWKDRLTAYSAHLFSTASEHFLRLLELIENTDDLRRRCKTPRKSHGEEAFQTTTGERLRFVARSRQSLRGFTGDRLVLDEAQNLSRLTMGAVLPTLRSRPNPQVNYFGTPPEDEGADSEQWESIHARGHEGGDPQLAWLEWAVQQQQDAEGNPLPVDLDDEEGWRQANPALGIRITREAMQRERASLGDAEFARECLALWGGGSTKPLIDPNSWQRLEQIGSRPGQPLAFGVNVSLDEKHAVIGVAGRRADGNMHVELVPCCKVHAKAGGRCGGTAWVAKRVAELDRKWKPNGFLLYPGGPAGKLIVPIVNEGVQPVLVTGQELAQACGSFYGLVLENAVRHLGQPDLNAAVGGARKRTSGQSWVWSAKDGSVEVAPLYAVTLAAHGADKPPKKKRRTGRAMSV